MVCKRKFVHVINIKILTSEPVCRILYRCNIESVISVVNLSEYSLKFVVWGYDAGIHLLETESTWKTTLKNKRNFTPVHFAAYLGRHKFLELLLKKTENVERPNISQTRKNRIPGEWEEDRQKEDLMRLLEHGEKKAEQDIPFKEFYFNVNEHLVSSFKCGTESFKKQ
jgi:hypothetical protein